MKWLITLLCLGLIAGLQEVTDQSSSSFVKAESLAGLQYAEPLIPSVNALKIISLGQPQIAADALWLQSIQYFGAGSPYANYPALGPIVNTITQLDPQFEEPYEFGMVVLPYMNQVDTALALGARAQTGQAGNGLLDYYYASDYMLYKKDYPKAAFYYQKAAKEKGSPPAAVTLAGTALDAIHNSVNDRLIAISYWQTVADNAKTSDQKQQALNQKENIQIVYALELAAEQYKAKNGHFPSKLQDLVTAGFINQIPASPIQQSYSINPSTGMVSFD